MLSRRGRRACLGIIENAEAALEFISGMSVETFENDRRTVYAVIRCLEIISEASRRVDAETRDRHPHIPWRRIANAGNVYRHEYENVAPAQIWLAVQDRLPELIVMRGLELQRPHVPDADG